MVNGTREVKARPPRSDFDTPIEPDTAEEITLLCNKENGELARRRINYLDPSYISVTVRIYTPCISDVLQLWTLRLNIPSLSA